VRAGQIVGRETLAAVRARHREAVAELPGHARQLSRGYPAIATVFEPDTADSE
jgi:nicotinate phosphoribosyltransferase